MGRRAELELFERALDEPASAFTVLFVHGPPGVGKSALLRELAALAAQRGRRITSLDLRQVDATPDGVRAGLGIEAGHGGMSDIDVLLLDTYEIASPLDGWVRESLIPTLPEGALVVIAGRLPPSPGWAADPGWRPLLRVVALRNLRPDDADELLAADGVDETERRVVLDETFGHPLALCLYLDLISQRRARGDDAVVGGLLGEPDVVRALLDRFADEVPSPSHRAALEVCAHVRFTTEELLRVAVDAGAAEAADLFSWLRGLSFVDATRNGLLPHDLARDLLDSDLRWRDEAGYDALHRRVRRSFIDQVRSPSVADRHRAAFGYRGHEPRRDPDGFAAFVRDVAPPDLAVTLAQAEPLTDVVTHRLPSSLRRRYERLTRFPEGFLVFGDAICSFNPIYGQGMTVAAMQAVALRGEVRRRRIDARRFFRAAARPVGDAWDLATGSDLSLPEVPAARSGKVRVLNAYVDRVLGAAEDDPSVAQAFLRIVAMIERPQSLMRPATVARVARAARRRARPQPSEPALVTPGSGRPSHRSA